VAEKSLWVEMPFDGAVADARDARHRNLIGPSVRTTFGAGEAPVCGFRGPDQGQDQPAELQVVMRRDGTLLRTVKVSPAGTGSPEALQVTLPVEGLPPGDYTVTVQEVRPGGAIDRGTVPLKLRPRASPPVPGA
jgi:hypothetical protein